MSPPPGVALGLLVLWAVLLFGVTNATGYAQWRAADESSAVAVAAETDTPHSQDHQRLADE